MTHPEPDSDRPSEQPHTDPAHPRASHDFPEHFVDLAQQLREMDWHILYTGPWRFGVRARLCALHGPYVLLASARPSNNRYGTRTWRAGNMQFYGQPAPFLPWHKFAGEDAFLTFATTKKARLLKMGSPVGSPLKYGTPRPRCECTKESFSEAEAKRIVTEAPFRRLHGHGHRRERNAYMCPGDPNRWHVTKSARYTPPPRSSEQVLAEIDSRLLVAPSQPVIPSQTQDGPS